MVNTKRYVFLASKQMVNGCARLKRVGGTAPDHNAYKIATTILATDPGLDVLAIEEGQLIRVRVRPPELEVLDNWLGDRPEPKPGRSESIRLELHDWLTGLSLLPHSHDREDRH